MVSIEGRFTESSNIKVAIVVARFNDLVTSKLLSGCLDCLGRHGIDTTESSSQLDIAWAEYVYGCTDPNASNYDEDANYDNGTCECAGLSVLMTMNDSWGDGWNGGGYVIQDANGAEVASGTMSGSVAVDEICISSDGTYSIYVADGTVAPASSYPSEITWALTSAENGQLIASGGAPYTPSTGDGFFTVPLFNKLLLFSKIKNLVSLYSGFCFRFLFIFF